jgi:hypothetical protein
VATKLSGKALKWNILPTIFTILYSLHILRHSIRFEVIMLRWLFGRYFCCCKTKKTGWDVLYVYAQLQHIHFSPFVQENCCKKKTVKNFERQTTKMGLQKHKKIPINVHVKIRIPSFISIIVIFISLNMKNVTSSPLLLHNRPIHSIQ